MSGEWAAVVLAGGRGARLGGLDKPGLVVAGVPLLRRAVDAVVGADPVVVVGPRRSGYDGVVWTREAVPLSGPVAAVAAGMAVLPARVATVVLLAADLPAITAGTVARLRAAAPAVLVDADGRRQWLVGAWPSDVLRAALPTRAEGASLRSVLAPVLPAELPDLDGSAADVDTPADLAPFTE